MSAAQIFTDWPGLGPEQQLTEVRRLIESVQEEEAREARALARANVAALEDWQEWLEQRQEDEREMTPEFLAAIERGKADLDEGRHRTVRP